MKIAILAPIAWRTPPRAYGPWEQVAANHTEGLLAAGHEVTLFATADSETSAVLAATAPRGYAEDPSLDAKVVECLHISHCMERAEEFDLIHNHFDFLPLTYSRLINRPLVTTIHGFSSERIVPVYQQYDGHVHYVSISNADRHASLTYAATVYNGIRTADFTYRAEPEDYLLYFGRIHPHKGAHDAIEIARRSGHRLILAGLIQDEAYFSQRIQPFLNDTDCRYVGNVGPADRDRWLGGARALLHPIYFEEPFGLSVAEAMLCGTPVIAYRRGSMPELIRPGETGYLAHDIDAAVAAVGQLSRIERANCRQWAAANFSVEAMVKGYEAVYARL